MRQQWAATRAFLTVFLCGSVLVLYTTKLKYMHYGDAPGNEWLDTPYIKNSREEENVKINSVQELGQLYKARNDLIKAICSERPDLSELPEMRIEKSTRQQIEASQPFAYCGIPKIASSFWNGVLRKMSNIAEMSSENQNVSKQIQRPFTFMFVRDPYERALSGYIDKLFAPNTLYWGVTGKYVIQRYRKNPTPRSLSCGHDVTFPEFFQYIIDSEIEQRKSNIHFKPIYRQCGQCRLKYDVIGHFETFTQDTDFILESLYNRTGIDLSASVRRKGTERARIEGKLSWVFGMRKGIVKCMTFQEALERAWKSLQIRGFLGKKSEMPLTREQADNSTFDQVVDVFLAARRSSTRSGKINNKREAMIEAFTNVPRASLERYIELYAPDFEMHGYDKRPSIIFDRKGETVGKQAFFTLHKPE